MVVVVGLGWLIRSTGPGASPKAALAASSPAASAAASAAAGTVAGGATADRRPGTDSTSSSSASSSSVASCTWPAPTSAVALSGPARARTGAVVNLRLRLSGPAAAARLPVVVAVSGGRVVGRLVTTVVPSGPRRQAPSKPATPTTPTASAALSGTLRVSTCAQALAATGSSTPLTLGHVLPPGRYQLIAVAASAAGIEVSAPVTVAVVHP
jgi:hypothetical protein